MKNTVTIFGRDFELGREIDFLTHINSGNYSRPSLYKCYAQPSTRKVKIYEDWYTWLDVNRCEHDWQYPSKIGVRSFNSTFFTIGITVFDGSEYYYIEVFPSRQIAHRLYGSV